jgi:hypothetical protein
VGEIGRNRREFLYDMSYLEILLIIRGYRRRNILQYQLQRIQAWAAMFCMGNKEGKQPQDIIPLYFDRYKQQEREPISQDEVDQLQREMQLMNEQKQKENEDNKIQTTTDN